MENTAASGLHPLRLGELFDQAIRIYRRNFFTFFGIVAIAYIPYAIFNIGASVMSVYSATAAVWNFSDLIGSPVYWLSLVSSLIALFIQVIFIQSLCNAVMVNAISRIYFGQQVSILEAYQKFGSAWARLLGAVIIFGFLLIGAVIWFAVPLAGWLTGIGLCLFLGWVVGHILPSVVVNEKIGGFDAISRSWTLANRRFWWLIGFAIIFLLFNALTVIGPSQLISYLTSDWFASILPFESAQALTTLAATLSSSLIRLLIYPIELIAWNLVYFDLRVRTEGFDLNLATMTRSDDVMADIASIPATPRTTNWLTWDEIGKFIIITLVIGGICALAFGLAIFLGFGLRNMFGAG